MEFSLELMAIVRTDRVDAKRDLFDHLVHKVDGVFLCVFGVCL